MEKKHLFIGVVICMLVFATSFFSGCLESEDKKEENEEKLIGNWKYEGHKE